MNPATQDFWNARYASDDYIFGTVPNQFLASQAELIAPGMRVLAVADGEGRNSVWLAEQGAHVHAVEVSPVALEKAHALAKTRGVTVQFEQADLLNWRWPEAEYDLVVAIFIQFASPGQREPIITGIRRALKPGGVLILQGYTPKQIEFATAARAARRTCIPNHCCATGLATGRFAICASMKISSAKAPIITANRR